MSLTINSGRGTALIVERGEEGYVELTVENFGGASEGIVLTQEQATQVRDAINDLLVND